MEPMLTEFVKTTTTTIVKHPGIIYKNQTGTNHRNKTSTKHASKRTPPLREEVTYQITLIGLRQRQGSLDRRRREKVIRKMFTEDDC